MGGSVNMYSMSTVLRRKAAFIIAESEELSSCLRKVA